MGLVFGAMTRGQSGYDVYCTDKETNEYFKSFVSYDVGSEGAEVLWPMVAEPDPPEIV